MTESPARAAADRYIAAINAGDVDALRAVFDHDATLVHPSGTYEGVDAILAYYRNIVLAFETRSTPPRSQTRAIGASSRWKAGPRTPSARKRPPTCSPWARPARSPTSGSPTADQSRS
jgi:hypothetical protein